MHKNRNVHKVSADRQILSTLGNIPTLTNISHGHTSNVFIRMFVFLELLTLCNVDSL